MDFYRLQDHIQTHYWLVYVSWLYTAPQSLKTYWIVISQIGYFSPASRNMHMPALLLSCSSSPIFHSFYLANSYLLFELTDSGKHSLLLWDSIRCPHIFPMTTHTLLHINTYIVLLWLRLLVWLVCWMSWIWLYSLPLMLSNTG